MGAKRKTRGFRLEIRIGVGIIILVLSILNIASYYTLARVYHSMESDTLERLAEASLMAAGEISRGADICLSDETKRRLVLDYDLGKIEIFPLNYQRVLEISDSGKADEELAGFAAPLPVMDISPVLQNIPLHHLDRNNQEYLLLFPSEYYGSKYIVASTAPVEILSAIAGAMRILLIFGLIVGAIILYVVFRLVRNVLRPYGILADEVRRANLDQSVDPDDINAVIESYEKLIETLKEKSGELLRMNELINRKADRLEIYNNHILRSIDTGIITIARDDTISTVNKAAADLLGIDRYEAMGKSVSECFVNSSELTAGINESLEKGKQIHNRELNILKGKMPKTVFLTVTPLIDDNNESIGHVVIMNDQTELKVMQTALENSRRMAVIGEMSSGLAHQLRNSVMAIMGFARLVEKKADPEGGLEKTAASLISETRQAEELVARFLDYARPLYLSAEPFALEEFLVDLKRSTESRHNGIELVLPSKEKMDLHILADSLLLKQALGNIIDNAARAYDGVTGMITIEIERNSEKIEIMIRDEAGGIPEEYQKQIFTPFFSGSPSGSGLGLPLAEKIISLHEGTIGFESIEGQGTTFSVTLPLYSDRAEQEPDSVSRAARE